MYNLYADGIHDDTFAIQELLDSGLSEVILPPTKAYYCISATLKIHSNQTLRLGETTTIRLLPHSVDIDMLVLENVSRKEKIGWIPSIGVDAGAKIRRMHVANVYHRNYLQAPLPLMVNKGSIEKLYLYKLDAGEDEVLVNEGHIGKLVEN